MARRGREGGGGTLRGGYRLLYRDAGTQSKHLLQHCLNVPTTGQFRGRREGKDNACITMTDTTM